MILAPAFPRTRPALALLAALVPIGAVAFGQSKKEQAELLAAPAADLIDAELLGPAARRAMANGVATLVARITAEGNDHGLAFPPRQTMKYELAEVPAKRVSVEWPVYEIVEVEIIEPVLESGQPTGRFTKVKKKVSGKKIGTRMIEQLRPDENGSEKMQTRKPIPGGPAAWAVNLPGLNGMALYVLAKAGLGAHPATVKHAAALAEHATGLIGLPDATFDLAWMAAGFAALGSDSPHEPLARRLLTKLIDGQIRERGELDGLWGPVCVNYGYYGKLFMLGQTVRQELDVNLAKKLETATGAEQAKLVAMGNEMKAVAAAYAKTHRDVFQAGTRMLNIQVAYDFEEKAVLPGLPYNAYQWVVSDVESTAAAAFAISAAKRSGLLPNETERLAIRGKKIHPPVRTDAAIKVAAKRMASAIDADGGAPALAFVAANKGFEKTGFPAPAFVRAEATPVMFGFQTACTSVAALETLESLTEVDEAAGKQLEQPLKRSRERAEQIAARWYRESATPAAETWKSMYVPMTVSHADLTKSAALEVPAKTATDVAALPWGPAGSLYRIVPGFRGLFAETATAERYRDGLFRQLVYRLVALQDRHGQWSSSGNYLLSTANESLAIARTADHFHRRLNQTPPQKIDVDPVSYERLVSPGILGGWHHHQPGWHEAAVFPTLASLLFLLEAIDQPVSLEGIGILPPPPEPAPEADPDKQPAPLAPGAAASGMVRPNAARERLCDAIVATRWPRQPAPAEPAPPAARNDGPPADKPPADGKEPREDDGLGTFEDLLKPADAAK
jgi:hypothetical protein